MKKINFVLPILAILIILSACPNGGNGVHEPEPELNPVTGLTIMDGSTVLTGTSVVSLTVNGQSKVLAVSISPANAESVAGFTIEAESGDSGKVTAVYNSSAKTVTVAPVAQTTTDITVTVKAKNKDNTGWITSGFKVHVDSDSTIVAESIELTQSGSASLVNNKIINIDLETAATIQLNAKILPEGAGGTVSWSSGDEAIAIVSGGLVSLKKAGSSLITATVGTVSASVTINTTIDPNLIFMWSQAKDGEPTGMGSWLNGTNNNPPFSGSSGIIPGIGSQSSDIPISIATAGTANNNQISYEGGIILDASGGQGTQKVISIGLASGRAPLSTTAVHPAGVFNFFDVPANMGIRVTVTGSVETESVSGNIRISLNNNSQNAANTMMEPYLASRLFYVEPPQNNSVPGSGMFVKDGSGKVTAFVSNIFKPSDFSAGADNLKTAHISISASDPTEGGGKIKVTGIRIEYVTIGSVNITINPEADFSGLPETIVISKTGLLQSMNLTLSKFTSAEWYIDGTLKATAASYLLDASVLKTGDHSLTVIVTIDGYLYSKSVQFTVAE